VDIESAEAKGIFVANVPATGANAESVAGHAMLLILSLLRHFIHNLRLIILPEPG
jgi:lactate dehydrogenase-like 2-hydroxyacid dehydrogenase